VLAGVTSKKSDDATPAGPDLALAVPADLTVNAADDLMRRANTDLLQTAVTFWFFVSPKTAMALRFRAIFVDLLSNLSAPGVIRTRNPQLRRMNG
jgi:hypothetical protein